MKYMMICTISMLSMQLSLKAQDQKVPVKATEDAAVAAAKPELPIKSGNVATRSVATDKASAAAPLRNSDPGGAAKTASGGSTLVPLRTPGGSVAKTDSTQKAIVPLRSTDPGGVAKSADPRPLTTEAVKSTTQTGTTASDPKTQLPSDVPVKKEQQ